MKPLIQTLLLVGLLLTTACSDEEDGAVPPPVAATADATGRYCGMLLAEKSAPPVTDTGSFRGDLIAAFCGVGGLVDAKQVGTFSSVLTALTRDEEFAVVGDEDRFYRSSTGYLYNLTAFAMTGTARRPSSAHDCASAGRSVSS